MAASGRLAETGMLFLCGVTIVGVLSLRAWSVPPPGVGVGSASDMSIADDRARAWERGDPGWMESELVLGFGGGGMARLEIASASAGVDSGASDSDGGLLEPSRGKGSELVLLMAGSFSCEDAMSGMAESKRQRSGNLHE
jgi:hypothetical protein